MFCFAHIPKNFFARFARDPPSGGSAFGRVRAEGEEELNIARRAELASRLFSVARLKNPSPCTGDRNQRFRPDFFYGSSTGASPFGSGASPGASSSARRGRPKGRPHLSFINHNSYRKHDNLHHLYHTINDSDILLNGFYFKII